jgi:hypothetical protein
MDKLSNDELAAVRAVLNSLDAVVGVKIPPPFLATLNDVLDDLATARSDRDVVNSTDDSRATELEWLKWFACNADFGPADGDVRELMQRAFMRETGKNLPEGWNFASDGETLLDQDPVALRAARKVRP